LVAGYHAAFEAALWVCDYFHAFQDLFNLRHQLERKAYGTIGKEDEAARALITGSATCSHSASRRNP
jgi:hypothetical protein